MTSNSASESDSVFRNGKIRPGIYKIQNVVGKTYVDIREHTKELCGRPAAALEGKGLWEILPSGPGYTIRRLEPGKPEQFCIMLNGLTDHSRVSVATFPVAWRIEIVDERGYCGYDYVRFFWGTTDMTWDLGNWGSDKDRTPVQIEHHRSSEPSRIWKLIPVKFDTGSQSVSGPLPESYDENPENQRCTCSHQLTEMSDDGFGTTVVEVTVTTTTTRKKYRVEGD